MESEGKQYKNEGVITETNKVVIFGRNYINVLGLIRNYGEVGFEVTLVWLKDAGLAPKESRYIKEFKEVRTINEGIEWILKNKTAINEKQILSTDNDEIMVFIDTYYDELSPKFYFMGCSKRGMMRQALQKEYQCNLAEKCGFLVPRTEKVNIGEFPKTLKYPIITKVADSTDYHHWKGCQIVCQSEEELKKSYNTVFTDFDKSKCILLQEYIEKSNELQIEGISYNSGKEVFTPIQVLSHRVHKNGYGTYKFGEIYHSGDDLKKKLAEMLKTIGYTGIFELELLKGKDGNLYFLEINLRTTMFNYVFTSMGINLCSIYAKSLLHKSLSLDDISLTAKKCTFMYEDRDFQMSVLHGDVSLHQWIKDLLNTDCFLIYNRKDLKPFVCRVINKISRMFSSSNQPLLD